MTSLIKAGCMNNQIMSVDPSLRSTGVYIHGDLYTIETRSKLPAEAAKENIYRTLSDLIRYRRPKICLIEDYSYQKAGGTASLTSLAEVRGIIQAICFEWDCRIVPVNIQMWKNIMSFKFAKQKKADKQIYIATAETRFPGHGFDSTDEVDAFMIYKAVEKLLHFGGNTESQKKLVNQVREILG